MTIGQYFSGLFGGIKSLLTGMGVTWRELFSKKITQQYPENRKTLVIPPRVRGELTMPHDESNEHQCTACGICQMNCPNGTIKIVSRMEEQEDGKKKKVLTTYHYDLGMCTFCNLCVLTCPSDAIKFSTEFENAMYRRDALNFRLNKEGSKLKEKKKVAPAPKSEAVKKEPKAPEAENVAVSATQADVVKKEPAAVKAVTLENKPDVPTSEGVDINEKKDKE